MRELQETELGRLLSFANGRSSPERADDLPYAVYGSNGIIGYTSEPNTDANSVIIGRVGSYCGSLYLSKQPCWVTDNAIRANARDGHDSRFLFYLLGTLGLNSWRAGSGQPLLNQEILNGIPVAVPELPEQRAIAHILGTLDDKIELNRRMSETLEAMARALFKSWFVDFDPVRAKAEGREPGLPKPLADRFPDRLVDSELGEIPEGWSVRAIGEMVQVLGGGTPSTKEPMYWRHGTHAFCTPKDMASLKGPVLLSTERHLTVEGVAKVSSGLLPAGVVLLSSRAPIGYLAVAEIPVTINQGIIAMLCNRRLPAQYVLGWARTSLEAIEANASGSTFPEISKRNFRPLQVVVPVPPVLDAFVTAVDPLHRRLVTNLRESEFLGNLRDTLVPVLISGELRVEDIEYHSAEALPFPSASGGVRCQHLL